MLECPKCQRPTKVVESRGERRRRLCLNARCTYRFTTKEIPEGDFVAIPWGTQKALAQAREALETATAAINAIVKEREQ